MNASLPTAGVGQYDHAYVYDALGNLTSYDGITYTYGAGQPHVP